MQTQSPIEILLVSDANYAAFLATTLESILENAGPADRFRFHIADGGLSKRDVKRLTEICEARPCELRFYQFDLTPYLDYFKQETPTFPPVVNYRMFCSKFLPDTLDKILYMDVDAAALKSLRPLWETPLDGKFLAAAQDREIPQEHLEKFDFPKEHVYFNSGILLLNLKKWREESIPEQLLEVCKEIQNRAAYADQDVLNVYASRRGYAKLPYCWNTHPKYYDENETAVMHYMGDRSALPHMDLLSAYAAKTPYQKLPFQRKRYYFRRFLKRKYCQLGCMFLFKRQWRKNFRKKFYYR